MTPQSDWPLTNTEHGLLVAFGEFLQQHGLLKALMHVPIDQKTRTAAPPAKLIEFLSGIMSGIEYLSDLNDGPRPLAKDLIVAQAWGQATFVHYSSVSRTLDACDADTVTAVQTAIDDFSCPFIRQAIQELLLAGLAIVYDLDLTGQAVSASSQSYPHVAFGWMNDHVQLGYQLARICFTSKSGERVWLKGFHHSGDTVSASCIQELIAVAETQSAVHPRRRTELVQQRLSANAQQQQRPRRLLRQQQTKRTKLQQTAVRLREQIWRGEQLLKQPILQAKSVRLNQRLTSWRARLPRVEHQLATSERVSAYHQTYLHALLHVALQLQDWLRRLEADNRANPDPPVCEVRIDSGFSSGVNLTWLIEMGYQLNTKAPGENTTLALQKKLTADAAWTRVGHNAEMLNYPDYFMHDCPYPLMVALERFQLGNAYRYATLLQFRDANRRLTLSEWFKQYNGRQLIEAGNKQLKSGVFHIQHLMTRSAAGIQLQVVFAGLAANVIHWCAPWLHTCVAQPSAKLVQMLSSPKQMVRVAANSTASVQLTASGTALQFAPTSALPGTILFLRGVPAFQLPLGLQEPCKITTDSQK